MPIRTLVIGNRNYSSWSLRPWALARHLGIECAELRLPLHTAEFRTEIGRYSPTGAVPVLVEGDLRIWDSLAIIEYLSELAAGRGWPVDPSRRAEARAVAAEMHSGFGALRSSYPMNIRARGRRVPMTAELAAAVARIDALWTQCRTRYAADGPWLFGSYSAADAMYLPVAFRFQTYGTEGLGALARGYAAHATADPVIAPWVEAAITETDTLPGYDAGLVTTPQRR